MLSHYDGFGSSTLEAKNLSLQLVVVLAEVRLEVFDATVLESSCDCKRTLYVSYIIECQLTQSYTV